MIDPGTTRGGPGRGGADRGAGDALEILAALPVAMFAIDRQHRVTRWNQACDRLTGVAAERMLGTDLAWQPFYPSARPVLADLVMDDFEPEAIERYYPGRNRPSELMDGAWEAEDQFPGMPGGPRWLAFTAAPLRDAAGQIIGAVELLRDISDLKKAEAALNDSQHLLSEIVGGCPVPMFVLDAEHRITHWNRACEAIVGTSAERVLGSREHWQPFYAEPRPVMADLVIDNAQETIARYYSGKFRPSRLIRDAWEATDYFPNFPSGPRWLYFTAAPLHGADGKVIGAVETLQDISEQKLYEQMLERQARFDPLTGVANRMLLEERLTTAISHACRDGKMLAVMFLDLDHFKPVNDTLGHAAGDCLLRVIAQRLNERIRTGDTLARVGGDEFVIVLYGPDSIAMVSQVADRIIESIGEEVVIGEHKARVGCSIGISMYPEHGTELPDLLRCADAAMYRSKSEGRNRTHFHTRAAAT